MNILLSIPLLLQEAAEPGLFNPTSLLFMSAIMLTIWLFWIRPQSKKIQAHNSLMEELDKGSKVVTMGGIHGKIIKDDQETYLLEVDSNSKIRISKSAISAELTQEFYGEKTKK